jgi:Fic family protein
MQAPDNQRMGRFIVSTVGGETVRAYVPPPLPPTPPVRLDSVQVLLEQANQALGRLDGLASFLPDLSLFIYAYVRKEALLSSQIEGTQSSLSDLLLFENEDVPGVPIEDVQDVSNYVAALSHGLRRIREGFPLSLRLIREIHEILLSRGRGSNKEPGEFRRSQNWIGGTRPGNAAFVPPPPELVLECMGHLEMFLHMEAQNLPLLVRAALAHVQFETIHPFLDGNGRLGRLLITFLLCAGGALSEPILYLSLYFKSNRQVYYDLLTSVRTTGNWEAWIGFFLTGVKETSEEAIISARGLIALLDADRKKIEALGRPAASVLRVFHYAQTHPILSIAPTAEKTGSTFPTVSAAIDHMQRLGILHEITGRQRHRLFAYRAYIDILKEGTEPLR